VNILEPDYKKYPALQQVKGLEVELLPGETLFIPRGYWHYIEYKDGGFSISLRSFDAAWFKFKGQAKILKNYVMDRMMNRFMGKRWYALKARVANSRAEKARF
jgi:hypothetical protein